MNNTAASGPTLHHVFSPVLLLLLAYLFRRYSVSEAGPGLPPGPRRLPIIGNLLDLPPKGVPEFQHWLKHKDLYGPISSVTVMGQTLIIIHDREAAHLMLNKHARQTAGRTKIGYALKLCHFHKILPIRPYDDNLRRSRKMILQQFGNRKAVDEYNDTQEIEARRLLVRILDRPQDLIRHFTTLVGAIILKIAYGYTIRVNDVDPLIDLVERMMVNANVAGVPFFSNLAELVSLPCRYLPSGFPQTRFGKIAHEWSCINKNQANIAYQFSKQQMRNQSQWPSFVSRALDPSIHSAVNNFKGKNDEYDYVDVDDLVKQVAATICAGGIETTSASLSSFLLAMTLFPEAQHKAQDEIDNIIGVNQLPGFEHRARLPYVDALVKEVHRWASVGPMSIPHSCLEELICYGHRIPKGAYIVPSLWWFCHDPETYPDPASFEPSRFLAPRNELDPKSIIFGHGRRSCPGRYFSDNTVYITVVHILACFSICKKVDQDGIEHEAHPDPLPGLACFHRPFPFSIKPRSSEHIRLIRSFEAAYPWEESHADLLDMSSMEV